MPGQASDMTNQSPMGRWTLRIVTLVTIVTIGVGADTGDIGCLEANDRHGPATTALTSPIPAIFNDRAALLQRTLGIGRAVPISDTTNAGIGRAVAPCEHSGSGESSARIETDTAALLAANSRSPMTVDLVLAHELSHVLQFSSDAEFQRKLCAGTLGDVKIYELLADFGAGYALYKVGRRNAQLDFTNAVAELADYHLHSPFHHGMTTERINAFNMGQASAFFGREIRMDALMRNKEVFLKLLDGENERQLKAAPTNYVDFARHALDEVYQ